MRALKILIIIAVAFGQAAFSTKNENCELSVEVKISNSEGGKSNGSAVMTPQTGVAPYKYIFLERSSGKLLNKDYTQKELKKLKKGNYKCLVVDENGCSKQVEFEIL
jgi:hypothetical protein